MSVSIPFFQEFLFNWANQGVIEPRKQVEYKRLVVFGSSYSDNGHFKENPFYSRTDNDEDRLWVDYLQKDLGLEQLNFAHNGALMQKGYYYITSQIHNYKTKHDDPTKKEIVALFTTTNDISRDWEQHKESYIASCKTVCTTPQGAFDDIVQTASAFLTELNTLIPEDSSLVAPDFLIFPVPPVDLTPGALQKAAQAGTDTKAIKEIAATYNAELMRGAQILKQKLGNRGNVFVYDIPGWFRDMHDNPAKYNLEAVYKACPEGNARDSPECAKYIWRDTVHLLPHLQRKVSAIAARLIRGR